MPKRRKVWDHGQEYARVRKMINQEIAQARRAIDRACELSERKRVRYIKVAERHLKKAKQGLEGTKGVELIIQSIAEQKKRILDLMSNPPF